MRMWKIKPNQMCNKHLLGEHVEMHMFTGSILKGKSIKGFIEKNLVEPQNIKSRHDDLAREMIRRGINHKSPLSSCRVNFRHNIPTKESINELIRRCPKCRAGYEKGDCL